MFTVARGGQENCARMARSGGPNHLLLQWHITDQCNLRCRHCYQEDYKESGPEFQQLLGILDQYEILLASLGGNGRRTRGQINITGGEPFVRNDFLQLLKEIRGRGIPFAILTNGTLIDRDTARFLKVLSPRYIQVSLEGTQERHDAIRGEGNHARVRKALRLLKQAGISTVVSFTAHRENFRDFPDVANLCRRNGVARLWSDRLIPPGHENRDAPVPLSPEETREFFSLMAAEPRWRRFKSKGGIVLHRALQFLMTGEKPYRCNAGYGLITILPDGTVLPCRRMPIPAGNLFHTSLAKIYRQSEVLQKLRDPSNIPRGCESCNYVKGCGGGLRCLAYALTGDPFRADPGCWLAAGRVS
jgi:radical SAM protein with 4Fe4S-binding SPASM domain